MRLDDATYEFIKGEAANVYRVYNIHKYPIIAKDLAVKMGFDVVYYSSLSPKKLGCALETSPDGFYFEANHKECIYINDAVEPDRRNMTGLHEIGHPVLGHDNGILTDEIQESEAKFFGKYLAAPPPLVHLEHPDSKYDLQLKFGLTDEASGYAFEYYGKWKDKVRRCGLFDYDKIILRQFGIYRHSQLRKFIESVKEAM